MTYRRDWVSQIRAEARRHGLDPEAVLAVASSEGLSGGVGDAGTSFGPFQLHVGEALPRGRGRSWAESPAGISYALRQMAGVARGLRGRRAVEAIVRGFERPADPSGEIARAMQAYGGVGVGVAPSPADAHPTVSAPAFDRLGLAQALINAPFGRPLDPMSLVAFTRQGGDTAIPGRAKASAPDWRPTKGSGKRVGRWKVTPALVQFAHRFGLEITSGFRSVAEQRRIYAHRSAPGSVAAPGKSFHNSGRAIDVAVTPAARAAYRFALAHPGLFAEAFFDPMGVYIKNGKIVHGAIGGHSDHIHFALR